MLTLTRSKHPNRIPIVISTGRALGKITMSDNEDWRRRKAEELGLTNSGPWISHTPRPPAPATEAALPRAPDAGAVRASAQGNAAEGAPTPLRTPSDVPDDVIYIDRRRRARPARPPAPSAASSAATSPGFARHRWRTRAATILAIGAGLSLALIIGLWLRGAAVPADDPLVVPTTAVPSSGAAAPAASSEPALSDASAAAGAKPEPMVDVIPEPAQPRFPSAATPPSADYAPLIMPAPSGRIANLGSIAAR